MVGPQPPLASVSKRIDGNAGCPLHLDWLARLHDSMGACGVHLGSHSGLLDTIVRLEAENRRRFQAIEDVLSRYCPVHLPSPTRADARACAPPVSASSAVATLGNRLSVSDLATIEKDTNRGRRVYAPLADPALPARTVARAGMGRRGADGERTRYRTQQPETAGGPAWRHAPRPTRARVLRAVSQ